MSLQTMTTVEVEANAAVLLQSLQKKAVAQGLSLAAMLEPLVETAPADKAGELESLRDSFELRDEAKVKRYLQQYDFLLPVLLEAPAQIARFFPASTRLALEVSWDPSDATSMLCVRVPTQLSADEAYDQMDKLDAEWSYAASEYTDGRMIILQEFI
ncbi:MAG: hypothetical protein HOP19_25060 [Acidobacteria bacterium]|nr:hypothetical protein [Acidobacteriota bacterium]